MACNSNCVATVDSNCWLSSKNSPNQTMCVHMGEELLRRIYRIEIIKIIVPQQMLASALQEMRKARYVSVLADEVTSRKTRRKTLLDFLLLQRTDVSKRLTEEGIIHVTSAYLWILNSS